jgi:hypothetical protein
MHKKDKEASFEEDEIIIDEAIAAEVETTMAECMKKMMNSGKAKNPQDAREMCAGLMAKSNFSPTQLNLILAKEL